MNWKKWKMTKRKRMITMKMNKIIINKNPNGDSRTAPSIPTFSEFKKANKMHQRDVAMMMQGLSFLVTNVGNMHDWSKNNNYYLEESFYNDFLKAMNGEMKFEDGDWAKIHYRFERHHLHRVVPEDVNLIDILEMIADCVCAGMARSGEVRDLSIDPDILEKAFSNTVEMCKEAVVLS